MYFINAGRSNCITVPNFVEIAQTTEDICQFSIFQNSGRHHLGFLKFLIFNGRNGQGVRNASPCQISVDPFRRYGLFSFFQDSGRRHLGFENLKFLTVGRSTGSNCIIMPNFVQIGPNAAEIWLFLNFSKWRPPPS